MKGETFSTPLDKDGTHINGKALSPFGGTYRIFFINYNTMRLIIRRKLKMGFDEKNEEA